MMPPSPPLPGTRPGSAGAGIILLPGGPDALGNFLGYRVAARTIGNYTSLRRANHIAVQYAALSDDLIVGMGAGTDQRAGGD